MGWFVVVVPGSLGRLGFGCRGECTICGGSVMVVPPSVGFSEGLPGSVAEGSLEFWWEFGGGWRLSVLGVAMAVAVVVE